MSTQTVSPIIVAVVGATATGKSDLGIRLARLLDGEIVNADAMQLYRGMDVGTAKLSVAERLSVPHHLLDVLEVGQEATVAAYQRAALRVVQEIRDRGKHPIVVGGSGLYVQALLDHLEIPPTDKNVRERWERELHERGPVALHQQLCEIDPVAGEAILPSNGRRVVRALEVVTLTGRPYSATMPQRRYRTPTVQLGLRTDRPVLDQRIADRVDQMWDEGLVEETRALLDRGLREGRTAAKALGYAQVIEYLDGRLTEAEARELVVTRTRRFARRQESWFRRDDRIVWMDSSTGLSADMVERAVSVTRVG